MADPTAVTVVIKHPNGKILAFIHNSDLTQVGLPAGFIDEGETPEQAALRELLEETGLTATSKPMFLCEGISGENLCRAYWISSWEGELLTADQVTGGDVGYPAWVSPHQLLQETFRFSDFSRQALVAAGIIAA